MNDKISFGAYDSKNDPRTVTSDDMAKAGPVAVSGKVNIEVPSTNDFCNQRLLGICTACSVRNAAEHHFADGVRRSEYWHYLIQKVLIDKNLIEGSSIFASLKSANQNGIPKKSIEVLFPLKIDGTYSEFINHFKTTYGGKIPQAVLDDASTSNIPGYYSVKVEPVAIARELESNKVVMTRFTVGDNTYKAANGAVSWAPNDLQPLRAPKQIDGGHAWNIVEWNGLDWNQENRIANSWSRQWCDNGYIKFIMGTQKPFFTEAWVISDAVLPPKPYQFTKDLSFGTIDPQVKELQKFLNNHGSVVSTAGPGSPGKETENFGSLTKLALINFQKANNIKPSAGYFGPITRGIVNDILKQ